MQRAAAMATLTAAAVVSIGWIGRRYSTKRLYQCLSSRYDPNVYRRCPAKLGDRLCEIETPALVVDLDAVRL